MNKRLVWNFEINADRSLHIPAAQNVDRSHARWESRFFWTDSNVVLLNGLDDSFLDLSHYTIKHRQDTYCILPEHEYNIKRRKNQLLYKPIMMKTHQAIAYGKKINLEKQAFGEHLPGVLDEANAQTLLLRIKQFGNNIDVEKNALIYRFDTAPTLNIELAKLRIAAATYFTVNIESHSKLLVTSITQQLFGQQPTCDYVTFLKGLVKK